MGTQHNIKTIIWDFDGVIVESNHIREEGFREVLSRFPQEQVEQLLHFHNQNGGLSRYVKFRHFFEEIRGEVVSEEEVQAYAQRFSAIMLDLMKDPSLLIPLTTKFIINNYAKYNMHIASGSDQKELRHLCYELNIAQYFKTIEGSPTPKSEIVKNLIGYSRYNVQETLLIGDAINDFNAASLNGIHFLAYNGSKELHNKSTLDFNLK